MKKPTNSGVDLNDMKGNRPYSVPDHYFDDVTDKILNSVKKRERFSLTVQPHGKKIRSFYLSAAAAIGILAITYLGVRIFSTGNPHDGISQNEVLEYFDFYSQDVDETLFLDNMVKQEPVVDITEEHKDAIITFLLDEGIDELTLMDEF